MYLAKVVAPLKFVKMIDVLINVWRSHVMKVLIVGKENVSLVIVILPAVKRGKSV